MSQRFFSVELCASNAEKLGDRRPGALFATLIARTEDKVQYVQIHLGYCYLIEQRLLPLQGCKKRIAAIRILTAGHLCVQLSSVSL